MLRTNLATRPFYNERRVNAVLLALGVLVVALTAFNVWQLLTLTSRDAALVSTVRQSETTARQLREDAARARASIDRERLEAVLDASNEANALIERRVFSWTGLLNQLETTLPPGVRVRTIRPVEDEGRLRIELVVLARRAEDVEAFVERLQETGSFRDVFTRSESTQDSGLLEVMIEGVYAGRPATDAPAGGGAAAAGPE
jgi:Tfp pilus assembly protein PilN